MSILQIQQRLLENAEQITITERAFGRQQSRSLQSSLKSLYKLRKYLESEFEEVAYTAQVDVVSYRIFEGNERPTMMLLGRALDSFQTLYAIMYATVSTGGPRDTAHLSSTAIQASSMEFAYAYSGSVGFVFTMPNERLLFGESKLDEAMGRLAEIAMATSTEEIKGLARRFGLAPIRAAYKWLQALSSSSVGVDIEWKKGQAVKSKSVLDPVQIDVLKNLIEATSELKIDQNIVPGVLLGFDSTSRRFRFAPSDGGLMMRGTVLADADIPEEVRIPHKYYAKVKTQTRVRYATEQPEVSHDLLALTDHK